MSDADREIVYYMKMEVDDGSEAEISKFAELSERIKRMLENDIRGGISKGFEGGFSNGARNGGGGARGGMAEAIKQAPRNMEQAGQTAGKLYVNGFRASLKRDIRTAINEAIREAAPPYRGSGAGFGGSPLPLIPNITRQTSQGRRPRRSGTRVVGFAGAALGYSDEADQKQIDRAQRDIDRLQRQMEAAQQKEAARDTMARQRTAEREEAADKKRHAANIAREEKYWADIAKIREREQAAAEKDERRRFQVGNRRLAALVKAGPKAVEQDRQRADRQAERERRNAEREQELAQRRQQEAQARVEQGVYGTVHAFGQLTRAAAQFGLIGQDNMRRVLDTIFAVEGAINSVQGGLDAFRAVRGLRGALAEARAGGGGRGAGGALTALGPIARAVPGIGPGGGAIAGGAAAAGGTAAGGTALAGAAIPAAAATVAAAIAALGAGAISDMVRSGKGTAGIGHVGGFYDYLGTKANGLGSRIAGAGLSAVGAAYNATAPFGLTSRERELRTESFLERNSGAGNLAIGGYLAGIPGVGSIAAGTYYAGSRALGFDQAALSNRRTERMGRFFQEERGRREQMIDLRDQIDATMAPLETQRRESAQRLGEERYRLRVNASQARGAVVNEQLGAAFGRQQSAFGEQLALRQQRAQGQFVSPEQSARAAADQAREEGRVAAIEEQQRNNLLTRQASAARRGTALGQELQSARAREEEAAGLGGSETARREAFAAREQAEERLKKNEEERAEIASRIRKIGIDGAQRQLQLGEQNLANAKATADTLRQQRQSAAERFGQMLPGQQRALVEAAEAAKRAEATGEQLPRYQLDQLRQFPELAGEFTRKQDTANAERGGFGRLADLLGQTGRLKAAEAQEAKAITLTVDNRNKIEADIRMDVDETAQELARMLTPIFERVHQATIAEVEKRIQRGSWDLQRRQNQQGKQLAGG